jgi:hypothetical protein
MANRTKLTHRAREKFLEVIRNTANVSQAARAVGITRRYLYQVKERDAGFSARWDDAVARATGHNGYTVTSATAETQVIPPGGGRRRTFGALQNQKHRI